MHKRIKSEIRRSELGAVAIVIIKGVPKVMDAAKRTFAQLGVEHPGFVGIYDSNAKPWMIDEDIEVVQDILFNKALRKNNHEQIAARMAM